MSDSSRPATVLTVGGASPYDVVVGHDLTPRLPDVLGSVGELIVRQRPHRPVGERIGFVDGHTGQVLRELRVAHLRGEARERGEPARHAPAVEQRHAGDHACRDAGHDDGRGPRLERERNL